jgi:hypothetical protein
MKRLMITSALVTAAICGCVPSIHGIATKENTVYDEQLIGSWSDPDKANDPNSEVWRFEKGDKDGTGYRLIQSKDGKIGRFNVSLVEVGDMLFMDLYPGDNEELENTNELYKMHLVGAHTFMRVDEISEVLRLRMMDPDAVKKMVETDPTVVKHEMRDDQVILTAGAEELQAFLLQYADQIFGDKSGEAMVKISTGEGE